MTAVATVTPHPGGRPRKYTPADIHAVFRLIRDGSSIRQATEALGMDKGALYDYLEAEPSVFPRYARALEGQGDAHREKILELAVKLENGEVADNVQVQALRVAIDARKWVASKLAPKVYGDYAGKGPDTINVNVETLHLTALKQLQVPSEPEDAIIVPE
jgi:hypothetical protein